MAQTPTPGSVNRWLVLLATMVGVFISILDSSAVNVALPVIMTTFGADLEQAKWISTGAMLTAAVTMPATGWLGRRFGLGRVYLASLIIFVGGSAAAALSWSMTSLVAARIVQSIGSGSIQPISLAILTRTFPAGERGRAIGLWGIGTMLGPALGPTMGGVIIEWLGWRSMFAFNVPIGLAVILIASIALAGERVGSPGRFDWLGYLSFATFIVALLLTVDNGSELGWGSGPIVLGFLLNALALAIFVLVEWDASEPLLPFRLFRSRDFVLALVLSAIRALALFGPVFLVPVFLQSVQGRDAFETGMLVMPSALSMAATMPLAGWLMDRFGGRWPTVAGFVISAYSLFMFQRIDALTGDAELVASQIWRGIGIAMILAPVNTAGLNAVRRDDAGYASWMLNIMQRYGGAFAVAILSLFLNRWTITQMELLGGSRAMVESPAPELVQRAVALGFGRHDATAAARRALRGHLANASATVAYQNLFLACAVFALLGVVPALFLARRQRRSGVG